MFNFRVNVHILLTAIILITPNKAWAQHSGSYQYSLIEILRDDLAGVDGLDNPRRAVYSRDQKHVFVTSGDDNAFAIFDVQKDQTLSLKQVFKNTSPDVSGLEGAIGIAELSNGNLIVTGFYDGAINLFASDNKGKFGLVSSLSDGFSAKHVFSEQGVDKEQDKLNLLAPWDVVAIPNGSQFLVASYMSNSVPLFEVEEQNNKLVHKGKLAIPSTDDGFGNPVGLSVSPSGDTFFVLGFEQHLLSVFAKSEVGDFLFKQSIALEANNCKNPQSAAVSPDELYVYVACSGTSAIATFAKQPDSSYHFVGDVNAADLSVSGLEGTSTLALTRNGKTLYAAGEMGNGVFIFSVKTDGRLQLKRKLSLPEVELGELAGLSSIALSPDEKNMLLTGAKTDALFVLEIE